MKKMRKRRDICDRGSPSLGRPPGYLFDSKKVAAAPVTLINTGL